MQFYSVVHMKRCENIEMEIQKKEKEVEYYIHGVKAAMLPGTYTQCLKHGFLWKEGGSKTCKGCLEEPAE